MPELGARTHIRALSEHDWNVEPAVAMLKIFRTDCADKLAVLQKVGPCSQARRLSGLLPR